MAGPAQSWRRDLETLVAARGERLRVLALRLVPDDPDGALDDALVDTFSRYRPEQPLTGETSHGSVLLDDETALDELESRVAQALALRANLDPWPTPGTDREAGGAAFERAGSDQAASDQAASDRAGSDRAGSDATRLGGTGLSATRLSGTGLSTYDPALFRRPDPDAAPATDAAPPTDAQRPTATTPSSTPLEPSPGPEQAAPQPRPARDRGLSSAPPRPARASTLLAARIESARAARARRRRRLGLAAACAVVAVVVGLGWATGIGRSAPNPTPTASAPVAAAPRPAIGAPSLCGSTLLAGSRAAPGPRPLTLSPDTSVMASSSTWSGSATISTAAADTAGLDLVGPLQLAVLTTYAGQEVAAVARGDIGAFDLFADRSLAHVAVRFPSCEGGALHQGQYVVVAVQQAVIRGTPGGEPLTLVSAPAPLTVRDDAPPTDADGRQATQPPWLEGTPVACGMAADAMGLLEPYLSLYLDVDSAVGPGGLGLDVTNTSSGTAWLTTGRWTAVAWVRDGRVVSVGQDELARPLDTQLGPRAVRTLPADLADTTDTCRPDAHGRFTHHLAPGSYTAIPYAFVGRPGAGRELVAWLVGQPTPVVLGDEGVVSVG